MRPVLAIVGRPNVGKSTLLNRLARRQVALVGDEPGVTRDRLFVETNLGDRGVILVDTGGFDPDPGDDMSRMVVEHAQAAIDEADLVLFVCDGKDGLQPVDATVADLLRKSQKPVLCLVNKLDPGCLDRQEYEFHRLGLDILPLSAAHGSGLDSMIDWVNQKLPEQPEKETREVDLRLCLLGRPNVGKSSLANQLSGKNRQIVSHTPGTTRDAVDIFVEQNGVRCLLVDTPGVRRKGRIRQKLEQHSVLAAIRSLERADVAVVVLDGDQSYADQDARLLNLVDGRGTGLVVAVNKIDLLGEPGRLKAYLAELAHGMRFVSYAPVLNVSAKTGKGVDRLIPKASQVNRGLSRRITTGDLNRFIADAVERLQPPLVRGRRGKIYFITQAEVRPPTFMASVNDPERIPEHYRRYLENRLRKLFPFDGVPLRWKFRKRGKEAGKKTGSRRKKR